LESSPGLAGSGQSAQVQIKFIIQKFVSTKVCLMFTEEETFEKMEIKEIDVSKVYASVFFMFIIITFFLLFPYSKLLFIFRIGQKNEVRVLRLMTVNSVEERILAAAR
jgi:hypothetical protein